MNRNPLSFRLVLALGTVIMSVSALAQRAEKPYVMTAQGKVPGEKLVASPSGDLTLTQTNGVAMNFKVGQYRMAWIPKPKEISTLEELYNKGQMDPILQQAPTVFNTFKFLGWGGRASYLEGMAQYEKKQYIPALQLFERGLALKEDSSAEDLIRGKVQALMALNKNTEAAALVDKLALAADERTAAFAFNVRGRLLLGENKKKDAVLQYLKTVLIFRPDGPARKERAEAKTALVALLKELGDQRANEFANLP